MKLYCMCYITGDVPHQARDSQGFGPIDNQVFGAPNRFGNVDEAREGRTVLLKVPMESLLSNVQQVTPKEGEVPSNNWTSDVESQKKEFKVFMEAVRKSPDVVLYQCPICRARIIVEE